MEATRRRIIHFRAQIWWRRAIETYDSHYGNKLLLYKIL